MIRQISTANLLRLILVTSWLLRVCYILLTGLDAPVTGDGPAYMAASEFITRGIYPPQWNITRPPLYPLLIATLWSFGENVPAAVRFLQCILDAFGCFFLARICQQLDAVRLRKPFEPEHESGSLRLKDIIFSKNI
jgi:hypothetical protein